MNASTLCNSYLAANRSAVLFKADDNMSAMIKIRSGDKIFVSVGTETVVLFKPRLFSGMKNPIVLTSKNISKFVPSFNGVMERKDSELFLLGLLMALSEGISLPESLSIFDVIPIKPIDFISKKLQEAE